MARPPLRFAGALSTLVAVGSLVGAVLFAVFSSGVDRTQVALTALLALPSIVVGAVVTWRRPDNPVGPLLSLQAAIFALMFGVTDAYVQAVAAGPGNLPILPLVPVLTQAGWMALYVPVALLLLVFPDGTFVSHRWRRVAIALPAVALVFTGSAMFSPSPVPLPPHFGGNPFPPAPTWLAGVAVALLPVFLGLLIASVVGLIRRGRSAPDAKHRAQLRWLALGAWTLPVTLLLCWVGLLLGRGVEFAPIGLSALAVLVPASVLVAMLRHDLYDVDRALSATVTWTLLTGLILAALTAIEIVVGLWLGGSSPLVAATATALAVGALLPLRTRAQRWVDGWIYPMRARLHAELSTLRRGVNDGTAQPEDLEVVLRRALHAPDLQLGLIAPGDTLARSLLGDVVDEGSSDPITLGDNVIGRLAAGSTPASPSLVREAATAAALDVEVVRLRRGLAGALSEVRKSRSRMLRHGYDERRRLQRDLHDGAQQRLVALGMSLGEMRRHQHDGDFDLDGALDRAVAQVSTAVAELRTIASGLRPPSLTAGLPAAIRSLASTLPLPVELELDPTVPSELPDTVATTAYYVVSEGVANALKHADPTRLRLTLDRQDGWLTVEVDDDGAGGAVPAGGGLAGLADRVAAAGGELRVDSPPDLGTRLRAVLPCGS